MSEISHFMAYLYGACYLPHRIYNFLKVHFSYCSSKPAYVNGYAQICNAVLPRVESGDVITVFCLYYLQHEAGSMSARPAGLFSSQQGIKTHQNTYVHNFSKC